MRMLDRLQELRRPASFPGNSRDRHLPADLWLPLLLPGLALLPCPELRKERVRLHLYDLQMCGCLPFTPLRSHIPLAKQAISPGPRIPNVFPLVQPLQYIQAWCVPSSSAVMIV